MEFPNIHLLRKNVEWVENQVTLAETKRRWYQAAWTRKEVVAAQQDINDPYCETAMCFAGKVSWDAGWTPIFDDKDSDYRYASTATKDGVVMEIERIAMNELGISDSEADDLFESDNTAQDIRDIAEHIAGEAL